MTKPRVCVLRVAGTNCDVETMWAFEKAGAEAVRLHVNRLAERRKLLDSFQILAVPGGFSYGDDIAAGRVQAVELMHRLGNEVRSFVTADKLVIGICNGFQVLVKTGLLPGGESKEQVVTLAANDSNRFEDRWVYLRVETPRSVFISPGQTIYLPVAHAEGKFIPENDEVLEALKGRGQVVFRYVSSDGGEPAYPENPNGSVDDVAGICDPTGRILGMMPHPERHVEGWHHPRWTREGLKDRGDGFQIFRNAVHYFTA
ncbi:MAG: phosphoribosylformylglycinamidine synthase [Planctomycetes bacterium DG_58]|nr:MAG: phosphoribosylformylglycinamidine synthase [Planctomycetes bacterium DG_58]